MFWSGNYIAVRELKFLLKEANVSLKQVLEADDILQECKADNNALIQFLTKPHVLAELITLITEEPSNNVDLVNQYRHANIACEVLTSHLSTLSDRLSMDTVLMNRLCDFINRDPPLNPLLASFFSKTIEMLLIRNPKQDWYLYHIVCLRVLDFFKSRRDFIPNLLRHISTSAITDVFKSFIRLDDIFNKIVMNWFEEYQFLEALIQIICGTYVPEEILQPAVTRQQEQQPEQQEAPQENVPEELDRQQNNEVLENQYEVDANGNNTSPPRANEEVDNAAAARQVVPEPEPELEPETEESRVRRHRRMAAVASSNASALLCELVTTGCVPEGCAARTRGSWAVVRRLRSGEGAGLLLQSVFTSPAHARSYALVNGCTLLRALLAYNAELSEGGGCEDEEDSSVELAVGPHLPLLHHALLHDPEHYLREEGGGGGGGEGLPGPLKGGGRVGNARIHVAALLAQLALCPVEEVSSTMLTLGTPGVLLDMFFAYPDNNFLHSEVHRLVKHALLNAAFRTQYARHLLVECDLLTRLMDAFEENENKKKGSPRSGYMGHLVQMLRGIAAALEPPDSELAHHLALPAPLLARWQAFLECALLPMLTQRVMPPPSDANNMQSAMAALADNSQMSMCGEDRAPGATDFMADGFDNDDEMAASKNNFLELASQRFDNNMWDDAPEPDEPEEPGEPGDDSEDGSPRTLLGGVSPWECPFPEEDGAGSGEGWAQFTADAFSQPAADPFAPAPDPAPAPAPAYSPADPLAHAHRSTIDAAAAFGDDDFGPALDSHFAPFWSSASATDSAPAPDEDGSMSGLESRMHRLALDTSVARSVELANNLLTAMSGMSPDDIAHIVSLDIGGPAPLPLPLPLPPPDAEPAEPAELAER